MGQVIDRAKRKAAGHAMLTLFSLQNGIHYSLSQVARLDKHEGLGGGLSPNEREFVQRLATTVHDNGETMRKLGHRFQGRKV